MNLFETVKASVSVPDAAKKNCVRAYKRTLLNYSSNVRMYVRTQKRKTFNTRETAGRTIWEHNTQL